MFLTTLLAAALCQSTATHGGSSAAPIHTAEGTAEGIEIFRRILVETLDKAFEEEKEGEKLSVRRGFQMHGLVTTLWAGEQTIQHSRAFHLPGVGLFFALDASLPVVAKEGEKAGQGEPPTNDEWERTRRELRGDLSADGTLLRRLRVVGPKAAGEIDPEAIEQVTDLALRTLARHVARIEGLAPNETITIALRLSGKNRTWLDYSGEDMDGEFKLDLEEGERPAKGSPEMFSAFVLATGQEAREQNLVIRIALADLAGLAEGTSERLRQRAQINRY